jgi:hypothetical protein
LGTLAEGLLNVAAIGVVSTKGLRIECAKEDYFCASWLLAPRWQWKRPFLRRRSWREFQLGFRRFCPEVLCRIRSTRPMTMAPDAVAFLGLVMEGAKTTNFAARYCPVMESVIAVAPQTIPELSRT